MSRHSGATSAEISLKRVNGSLELKVSDSGKGFDVEKFRKDGGLGLVSIEERLRLLRGTCEIDSSPQKGRRSSRGAVDTLKMNRIRLLLADDHMLFAEGLQALLRDEFELLGTVANGKELVEATHRLNRR